MNQIQKRMKNLDIKQVDMILELQKRGIVVQPPELSQILRGVYTYPKAKKVLDECDKILSEHEAQ
ncbi:MAG: hypothetical protein LBN40_00395 [Oscillospiraceae bacterium]|jgi:hypothetical protein|nr:hypothetical protein [Oscillospiraceae bacterium]